MTLETCLVEFLLALQDKITGITANDSSMPVHTCHQCDGQIFWAHPNWMGNGPWRDWAMTDCGDHGELLVHIWCFVKIGGIPDEANVKHGGMCLEDGICVVVESSDCLDDDEQIQMSDMFIPLIKDTPEQDHEAGTPNRTFHLTDVDAITGACCVVPNIGGPINHCFQVKKRSLWAQDFINWLEAKHADDDMEGLD